MPLQQAQDINDKIQAASLGHGANPDHVEGFAPEVAWVTKSGESDLEEPVTYASASLGDDVDFM